MRKFLILLIFVPYIFLYFAQNEMIFPAYVADMQFGEMGTPAAYGLEDFAEIELITKDWIKIYAWHKAAAGDLPIILYLHGNAVHLGGHAERFKTLTDAGYGLLALSWRGYGKSEGEPSAAGFIEDAAAALQWLEGEEVIIYGESIGTYAATHFAKPEYTKAVILQGGFYSLKDLVEEKYWFLPFLTNLLHDEMQNQVSEVPILFIHFADDNIVPMHHAMKLYEANEGVKKLITIQENNHIGVIEKILIEEITNFVE